MVAGVRAGIGVAVMLGLLAGGCAEDRRRGGGSGSEGEGETPTGCAGVTCSGHGRCATLQGEPVCVCDDGYRREGLSCLSNDPCAGVDCDGHGSCTARGGQPYCTCTPGYTVFGPHCLAAGNPCAGQVCSHHGICTSFDNDNERIAVCICATGYTPSSRFALDCVPTATVCKGGEIRYDVDDDGDLELSFEPTAEECEMFELINRTRATHETQGAPECHHPLQYSVEWSAHGRNHSKKMKDAGELYHEDFPGGQNCAVGCDPACEMNLYMTGPDEPHCPAMSHHCNIMSCSFSFVGVGTVEGHWNTQNFY